MAQRPTVTRPCRERQQRSSARPQRTCLQALPQRGASKHHHRGAKHRNNRALHARGFRAAAHGRGKPPAALVAALSSHEPGSTKGRKGGGDRRQGGRATPLRDRKEFHGRRAARKAAGILPAGGSPGTARRGGAQQRGVNHRAHFLQPAARPCRPSVADSQRGGFAPDYRGPKQGAGRVFE